MKETEPVITSTDFDTNLKKVGLALDDASQLLLALTCAQRCSNELPSPGELDAIQGVLDDAAGHLANFASEAMDPANWQYGRDDLVSYRERFMSELFRFLGREPASYPHR